MTHHIEFKIPLLTRMTHILSLRSTRLANSGPGSFSGLAPRDRKPDGASGKRILTTTTGVPRRRAPSPLEAAYRTAQKELEDTVEKFHLRPKWGSKKELADAIKSIETAYAVALEKSEALQAASQPPAGLAQEMQEDKQLKDNAVKDLETLIAKFSTKREQSSGESGPGSSASPPAPKRFRKES